MLQVGGASRGYKCYECQVWYSKIARYVGVQCSSGVCVCVCKGVVVGLGGTIGSGARVPLALNHQLHCYHYCIYLVSIRWREY